MDTPDGIDVRKERSGSCDVLHRAESHMGMANQLLDDPGTALQALPNLHWNALGREERAEAHHDLGQRNLELVPVSLDEDLGLLFIR